MTKLLASLIYATLAGHAFAAAIDKRQTPEQAAQLEAQKAQLASMNAPKLAADAAYQASAVALISSQAAAQTADQSSLIAAHSKSDADWLAAQIATISAQAAAMGLSYSVPTAAVQPPVVQDLPVATPESTVAPTPLANQNLPSSPAQAPPSADQAPPSNDQTPQDAPASAAAPVPTRVLSSKAVLPQPADVDSSDLVTGGYVPAHLDLWTSEPCQGQAAPGSAYTGEMTYYGLGLGSCGIVSAPGDYIVAVGASLFDSYAVADNSNKNQLCGKWVHIHGTDGKTYKAQIVDRCPGCQSVDLDTSKELFDAATNRADGRAYGVQWSFA